MNRNRSLLILILIVNTLCALAQDPMPYIAPIGQVASISKALSEYNFSPDTISVEVSLPEVFSGICDNQIIDQAGVLTPILERLRLARMGVVDQDSIRILHIGDSHVRGRIFPRTAGEKMTEIFGPVIYDNMGVNGATCLTFTHPKRIDEIIEKKPELIILSFGTNESHNRRYNANIHYNQIDELVKLLRQKLPGVPIMLTTPPGSYESFRQRNRRRTYSINPRTVVAADNIKRYASEHNLAVWDMFNLLGGKENACKNWQAAKLMRPDHVHYLPEAYMLQGELLYQAIINAYNQYVFH